MVLIKEYNKIRFLGVTVKTHFVKKITVNVSNKVNYLKFRNNI